MKRAIKRIIIWAGILALGILGSCVHEEQLNSKELESRLEVMHEELIDRGTIIAQQERNNLELNETLEETLTKLQLITTFQDAGYSVTPEDVRDLLTLSASLPFGSPFPSGHRITSQFGLRSISRYGWVDKKHLGIDLVPLDGDPTIIAPADCYITDYGWSDIFGYYVEMQTTLGYRLFMGHLDRIYWPHVDDQGNWSIDPEQIVKKGTRIADVGQTGTWALGVHLHYEIWTQINENWVPLDPIEIINYVGESK